MADNSLAGGGVGVGIYEAAGGGIVISALQIIEASFLIEVVTTTVWEIVLYWRAIMRKICLF